MAYGLQPHVVAEKVADQLRLVSVAYEAPPGVAVGALGPYVPGLCVGPVGVAAARVALGPPLRAPRPAAFPAPLSLGVKVRTHLGGDLGLYLFDLVVYLGPALGVLVLARRVVVGVPPPQLVVLFGHLAQLGVRLGQFGGHPYQLRLQRVDLHMQRGHAVRVRPAEPGRHGGLDVGHLGGAVGPHVRHRVHEYTVCPDQRVGLVVQAAYLLAVYGVLRGPQRTTLPGAPGNGASMPLYPVLGRCSLCVSPIICSNLMGLAQLRT